MNYEHAAEPDSKVLFRVEIEDGSADVETLWAYSLGEDNYKIDNLPWFSYGVSWHDVIYAPYDPDEETATIKYAVLKSGNRTVRIIFETPVEDGNESQTLLNSLVEIGCSYEGANKNFIAVNVPPSVELDDVVEILNRADKNVGWEFADPTYDELYPDKDL